MNHTTNSLELKKHILSKSTFLRGLKCKKSLWLNKFHKKLKDPISSSQQAIFDRGNQVGQLALRLFPKGKDATPDQFWDYRPSIKKTQDWIKNGDKVIYEAAFQYNGVLSALDIFIQNEDKRFEAYEVKSSTEIQEYHLFDAALQYYVMNNSGYQPNDFFLVTINNQYVRDGDIEVEQLFKVESVLDRILPLQESVKQSITECKHTLAIKQMPSVKIGSQCNTPHTCDFKGHCWSHVPEYSIFDITRIGKKAWDLYNQNILTTTELSDDLSLFTENQQAQIRSDKTQSDIVDKLGIKTFLKKIEYPAYYTDFETFGPAIPAFDGTKPYRNIPFQYSIHIALDSQNENLNHLDYLANHNHDPRRPFIEQLITDLGDTGSIIVYNQSFEKMILNDCKDLFPDLTEKIDSIIGRIIDLLDVFRDKLYYTPQMQGSYSIKKVLPALVPHLNYSSLHIGSGDLASQQYEQMVNNPLDRENSTIRQHLLEYCEQDTLAMVEIVKVLQKKVS